jgi:group I intron endonuclease
MLGFAYEIPDAFKGPGFPSRTYENIRRNRPNVIALVHQVAASNAYNDHGQPVVYVAVNTVNNKLYVGVTKRGLAKRVIEHLYKAKNGTGLFARAIRKYGKSAFQFLIFARCYSYERALLVEQELIAAIMPEYNLTAGGDGNLGRTPSEETRKRISDANRGRPGTWANGIPPEQREKMLAGQRAMVDPGAALRGRKRPPEVVKKIADKRRGKSIPSSTPELRALRIANMNRASRDRSIAVMCLSDGRTYPTIKAAALFYGISKGFLQNVVNGKYGSNRAKGLAFEAITP